MYNLLYKEFRLAIPPFFIYGSAIFGLLMLIPQWIYFLVPLYFCFTSIPNMFSGYRANYDLNFSALLPISKDDIVKARIGSVAVLELLHIAFAAIFAVCNHLLYHLPNFAFDLNAAYFGFVFLIYGIFNIILFPMFFKTGYKFGVPVIIANVVVILFALAVEMFLIISDGFERAMEHNSPAQAVTLLLGMGIFVILTWIAYRVSSSRFSEVDI